MFVGEGRGGESEGRRKSVCARKELAERREDPGEMKAEVGRL